MIESLEDYKYYCGRDKKALGVSRKYPRIVGDEIWKYEILLRKQEYLSNCNPFLAKIRLLVCRFFRHRLALKCGGIQIPINVFEEGLAIVHYGCIVVSSGARIGKNCRIHEGVTIGSTNHEKEAAQIGDNCFIGSGAKIIGKIMIGNEVAIGAGAVVVKSFGNHMTIAGVPARKISDNSSRLNHNEELLMNNE